MNSGTREYRQIPSFRRNEDLRKLGKEYLNASLCKFVVYSSQHSETFDVSHIFLPLTIAELSTLKQVRFLLAHPVAATPQHETGCKLLRHKTAETKASKNNY